MVCGRLLFFSFGFLGGFLLWIVIPTNVSFKTIRKPYWITLAIFIFLHRVEENIYKFQEELSKLTGNPVPEITSPVLVILVLAAIGGWLLVPYLMGRGNQFGYYLAWSFFASMGITELAHFIFPFLVAGSYGYFPGMASVILLAPAAWWGMWCLSKKSMPTS